MNRLNNVLSEGREGVWGVCVCMLLLLILKSTLTGTEARTDSLRHWQAR